MQGPLLEVRDLVRRFPVGTSFFGRPAGYVSAVDGISFSLGANETLGVVGESGCGKSTAGKTITRLLEPDSGDIVIAGKNVSRIRGRQLREMRRDVQMVFQDPYSSLNGRMKARDIVAEPLRNFGVAQGSEIEDRVADLFRRVGLRTDQMGRLPHEFSGGQRQRIGIARALALKPKLIVCDEPVSALDVSVQAQVVNLLSDLQDQFGLSYLFIAHDLAVVEHISHRVAVMYLGRIVEVAEKRELFANPKHPYTEALLSAAPNPVPGTRRKRILLKGDVPSPTNPPTGCRFHTRCPIAVAACARETPKLKAVHDPTHLVACHLRT
jgi:oligopeptide/dipeptide ABC transporter ATP-binding protein